MWILLDDGYISIVADAANPERVQIRARHPDHLQALFPGCEEWCWGPVDYGYTPNDNDYKYTAVISKEQLKRLLCERVDTLQIGSFRHRIRDALYHDAVQSARKYLHAMQPGSPYRNLLNPGGLDDEN